MANCWWVAARCEKSQQLRSVYDDVSSGDLGVVCSKFLPISNGILGTTPLRKKKKTTLPSVNSCILSKASYYTPWNSNMSPWKFMVGSDEMSFKGWSLFRWHVNFQGTTPKKANMTIGTSTILKMYSYWKWGFSNVMLICRGVMAIHWPLTAGKTLRVAVNHRSAAKAHWLFTDAAVYLAAQTPNLSVFLSWVKQLKQSPGWTITRIWFSSWWWFQFQPI